MNGEVEGLPAEVTIHVMTEQGFTADVKVVGLESNQITAWLKKASLALGIAGFLPVIPARTEAPKQSNGNGHANHNDDSTPVCPDCHGPTEFKNGSAKNGKPWAGYFCIRTKDAPRNSRHTPVWV